jgi:hypothetical protein
VANGWLPARPVARLRHECEQLVPQGVRLSDTLLNWPGKF